MNKSKQNEVIAKICGWKLKWQNCGGAPLLDTKPKGSSWEVWIPPENDKKAWKLMFYQEAVCPPDYLNDLNAINDVVFNRCNDCKSGSEYARNLVKIVLGYDFWQMPIEHQLLNHWEMMRLSNANAAQKSEALLKTLDLWE